MSRVSRLVTWRRPVQPPKNGDLSQEQWDALPEEMEVRLIKVAYEDRTGRKRDLVVVTTLLDNQRFDDFELSDLYARRWDIELKLRDLKTTLGLEFLDVHSPAMARKRALMMMIANNLIRTVMQEAAIEAGKPVWQLSFKGILDVVLASHPSFRALTNTPLKRRSHHRQFIELCATKLLDLRPFRHEPRAVKRRPKSHAYLTAPRHEYREIPHREQHRKAA